MSERKGDWIQTYTGGQFWPLDPRPEEIVFADIAHALSNQCRFTGHTRVFYSVAEHSVRVSELLLARYRPTLGDAAQELALWGLLHDASEAYLVDVPRPVKRLPELAAYTAAEELVMDAVARRFELAPGFHEDERVKLADKVLLATEARDLIERNPISAWTDKWPAPLADTISPWSPVQAKRAFWTAFETFGGVR